MPTKKTTKKSATKKGKKGGLSTVAVGAAGAVVGAALGGATAAALSNEKTRKSLGEVVGNIGEYASDAMDTIDESITTAGTTTDQLMNEAGDKAKKAKKK
jgi:hypothetical protein